MENFKDYLEEKIQTAKPLPKKADVTAVDAGKDGWALDDGFEWLASGFKSSKEAVAFAKKQGWKVTVLESVQVDEADSIQTRMKKKAAMKRNKAKLAIGRKKAEKKIASPEKLKARAEKQARDALFKKLAGGKSRNELSMSAREAIEKKLDKKKAAISKLAKKLLPQIKKAEKAKKSAGAKGEE